MHMCHQHHSIIVLNITCTDGQVWEQEFAWTEADKPVKLAARALTVPGNDKLNRQPIFCFETMMHMLYWSCLVYDHKRVSIWGVSIAI